MLISLKLNTAALKSQLGQWVHETHTRHNLPSCADGNAILIARVDSLMEAVDRLTVEVADLKACIDNYHHQN